MNKIIESDIFERNMAEGMGNRDKALRFPDSCSDDKRGLLAIRYTPGGKLSWANDEYCCYCKMEQSSLMGRNFVHRVPMDDLLRISRAVTGLCPARPACHVMHHMMDFDGRLRTQLWIYKALFTEHAEILEFVAVGRDVSDRKNDRNYLKRIEQELEFDLRTVLRDRHRAAFVVSGGHDSGAGAGSHA